MNQGKKIEDTFKKEQKDASEDLDQDREEDIGGSDVEEDEREDLDFDEDESDRSDPFETGSESDCLSRGSALSDYTQYADMKVEECRVSEVGAVFKLPIHEKQTSPEKALKVVPPRYNAFQEGTGTYEGLHSQLDSNVMIELTREKSMGDSGDRKDTVKNL